jgi:5-(carboxyamino)imidazole ribonucleotide synthase
LHKNNIIKNITKTKIGVLGGGQLGRMLQQEASTMDLDIHFLDKSIDFPAGLISHNFQIGNFQNFDDVLSFGQDKDILTIEIENVNTEALKQLEVVGKKVYPQPNVIETIKDKGLQKQFYLKHSIPTSNFFIVENKNAIIEKLNDGSLEYPFVQKSRLAGYDGKGVAVITSENDIDKLFNVGSVIEELIDIEKELAVIIARNERGEINHFPITEMVFNEKGNLLDYLICPSDISENINQKAIEIAKNIIMTFEMVGILAVELFLTKKGDIIVNEVAPRTHNSGHHTIDANINSQFNLHLRSILNLSLGSTEQIRPFAALLNVIGDINSNVGKPTYHGLEAILNIQEVYPHFYGKKVVKPLRKMGHVNITATSKETLIEKIHKIKNTLIVNNEES